MGKPAAAGGSIYQTLAGTKAFAFRMPATVDRVKIRKIITWISTHVILPTVLVILATSGLISRQGTYKVSNLSRDDRQQIGFEFDRYFVANTLALQPAGIQLEPIALAGQNQGGPAHVITKTSMANARSEAMSSPTPINQQHLSIPLEFTYISQGFNAYVHPGLDFVAPYGTPIMSAAAGCVKSTSGGYGGGYGNLVILDHGNGYTTRYAHLQRFAAGITPGTCIGSGALLGYVGLTGRTTGAHLHFELRLNNQPLRPIF